MAKSKTSISSAEEETIVEETKPGSLADIVFDTYKLPIRSITKFIDNTLGNTTKWSFEIQHSNYPPGFVAVNGVLRTFQESAGAGYILGQSYPGLGVAPSQGDLFAASREATKRALLAALEFAGADVEYPEDEVVDNPAPKRAPAKRVEQEEDDPKPQRRAADAGEGAGKYLCADCEEEGEDAVIRAYTKKDGSQMSPKKIADWAQKDFNRPLCWNHLKGELDKNKPKSGGYNRGGGGYRGRY